MIYKVSANARLIAEQGTCPSKDPIWSLLAGPGNSWLYSFLTRRVFICWITNNPYILISYINQDQKTQLDEFKYNFKYMKPEVSRHFFICSHTYLHLSWTMSSHLYQSDDFKCETGKKWVKWTFLCFASLTTLTFFFFLLEQTFKMC